jgi:hypothetical protein
MRRVTLDYNEARAVVYALRGEGHRLDRAASLCAVGSEPRERHMFNRNRAFALANQINERMPEQERV